MEHLDLAEKYRPRTLDEVYGQKFAVQLLKRVAEVPYQAPHSFFVTGKYGTGKTTLTRAFARTLEDKSKRPVAYEEIDSTDSIMDSAEYVRMLLMSATPGFRVVAIDEAHRVSPAVQAELLKLLEDNISDEVFVFLMTNEAQDVSDALKSRLMPLQLSSFSVAECREYINGVCRREGVSFPDDVVTTMAVSSMGSLRSCIKGGVETAVFMGVDKYRGLYSPLWDGIRRYFTDFSVPDADACRPLFSYHPVQLREFMQTYFREYILMEGGEYHKAPFPPQMHPKLFQTWCKLLGVCGGDCDFASLLVTFRGVLSQFAKAVAARNA